jgi:probable lipoprotein (TIGR04455 family)
MKNTTAGTLALTLTLLWGSGCAVVKMARVSPEWERGDRERVKRLLVLTAPHPAADEQVARLWSTLAARQVDLKRNFIIVEKLALPGLQPPPASQCDQHPVDAVLWLRPTAVQVGAGAEVSVEGRLFRCTDGVELWAADAAGSWPSRQQRLQQTIAQYVEEFGPEVEPFVAPSYRLLQATLETLPDPVLTEDDQLEKIENVQ